MKFVRLKKLWLSCSVWLVLGGIGQFGLHAETRLSAEAIMQRAASRSQQAGSPTSHLDYAYTKLTVTDELDAAGRVKGHKEKKYQVCSQAGTTSSKLLAVNGHPPVRADVKEQSENELSVRQLLGQPKSGPGVSSESFLTPELVARFDFRLLGKATLNQRPVYQIAFQPKTPAPPVQHLVDRVLNQISGTLWIDAEEFEVARAEVHLRSEISVLGGVVGCLKKMAYTIIRTRVAEGFWFNSFSSGHFEGRKLLEAMRIQTQSQARDFRLLTTSDFN